MKKWLGFFGALLFSGVAIAQTTIVVGVVTDSDSTLWANGTVSVQFVPNSSQPNLNVYRINGAPLSSAVTTQGPISLGSGGSFSVTVYDNTQVTPSGSQWQFTICPQATSECGSVTTPVSGSGQSITTLIDAVIPAPRFPAVIGNYGYADVEAILQLVPGNIYYNVTNSCYRDYNGSIWGCITGQNLPIPVPIIQGGTGATTAAGALANLGGAPLTGTGTSGTWPISTTGNAATATQATNATNLAGGDATNAFPYQTAASTTAFATASAMLANVTQWCQGIINDGATPNDTVINACGAAGTPIYLPTNCQGQGSNVVLSNAATITSPGIRIVGGGWGNANCRSTLKILSSSAGTGNGLNLVSAIENTGYYLADFNLVGAGTGDGTRTALTVTGPGGIYGGGWLEIHRVSMSGFSKSLYLYEDNFLLENISTNSDLTNPGGSVNTIIGGTGGDSATVIGLRVGCSGSNMTALEVDGGVGGHYDVGDANNCSHIILAGGKNSYTVNDNENTSSSVFVNQINASSDFTMAGWQGTTSNSTAPIIEQLPGGGGYIKYHGWSATSLVATNSPAFTVACSTTGGTIPDGQTRWYGLEGYNATGHTKLSATQSVTTGSGGGTNSCTMTLVPLSGITTVTPSEGSTSTTTQLFSTISLQVTATSWVDTGALTPSGTPDATATLVYPLADLVGSGSARFTADFPPTAANGDLYSDNNGELVSSTTSPAKSDSHYPSVCDYTSRSTVWKGIATQTRANVEDDYEVCTQNYNKTFGWSANLAQVGNFSTVSAASDTTLTTANTFYTLASTAALAPGANTTYGATYSVGAGVTFQTTSTASAVAFTCAIKDGSTVLASGSVTSPAIAAAAQRTVPLSIPSVAYTDLGGSPITFVLSCTSDTASQVAVHLTPLGSLANATYISAVRIR